MQARVEALSEAAEDSIRRSSERSRRARTSARRSRARADAGGIVAQHRGGQVGNAIAAQTQARVEGNVEASGHVIEALAQTRSRLVTRDSARLAGNRVSRWLAWSS